MFKEIGSNFWLEPKQFEEQEYADLVFRYVEEGEDVVYTSSGRGAISLLLEQISHDHPVALLPLYTCESVILPFTRKGYEIHYYDVNLDLSVKEKSFMEYVKRYKPSIVFAHAYFGFDTLHHFRSKYKWLIDEGITIIEDITHSLFSEFKKTGAGYYLASLRKWLALPDGGVAITIGQKIKTNIVATHEELVKVNLKANRLKYEYIRSLDSRLKDEYRKLFYSTEELLNTDCGIYAMSAQARTILGTSDFKGLRASRRSNYAYLLKRITRQPNLKPVFADLPAEVVPLYLPVYVNGNRTELRKHLAANEIYAPIHWDIPEDCVKQLTKNTAYIYNHILSIPCDQRYSHKDIERILVKLTEFAAWQ